MMGANMCGKITRSDTTCTVYVHGAHTMFDRPICKGLIRQDFQPTTPEATHG